MRFGDRQTDEQMDSIMTSHKAIRLQ